MYFTNTKLRSCAAHSTWSAPRSQDLTSLLQSLLPASTTLSHLHANPARAQALPSELDRWSCIYNTEVMRAQHSAEHDKYWSMLQHVWARNSVGCGTPANDEAELFTESCVLCAAMIKFSLFVVNTFNVKPIFSYVAFMTSCIRQLLPVFLVAHPVRRCPL